MQQQKREEGAVARGRVGRPADVDGRAKRRAQLLEAAERAIARLGSSVSMDQIAAEAGVTKPVIYQHFNDKAGLHLALLAEFETRLRFALAEPIAAAGGGADLRGIIESGIDSYLTVLERERALYQFLVDRIGVGRQPGEISPMALTHRFGDVFTIVIGEQLRRFGLDSGGAPVWGHALAGLAATVGDWWLMGPTMPRERVAAYLTDLVWSGFTGAYVARYGSGAPGDLSTLVDPPTGTNVGWPVGSGS